MGAGTAATWGGTVTSRVGGRHGVTTARVAPGEWGRKAVRRKGVPRRADRRTETDLGVRA
jgi:hypothetical protein